MTASVEIIQFFRPMGGGKNLFVTNLPGNATEESVQETLFQDFSKYGLLFEVQVFPLFGKVDPKKGEVEKTGDNSIIPNGCQITVSEKMITTKDQVLRSGLRLPTGWYGFVKFYSSTAASRAKVFLNGKLALGQPYKITYAKRRTIQDDKPPSLYIAKCQQLANYYLGFNGWSSTIVSMENDCSSEENQTKLRYLCCARLDLTNQGLHCDGIGVWEESINPNDPSSKCATAGRVKKIAYQLALENAFSRVVLVVLSNGKVSVEINTTKVDQLNKNSNVLDSELLKVNELDFDPETEDDGGIVDEDKPDVEFLEPTDSVLDDMNIHLLQDLEDT